MCARMKFQLKKMADKTITLLFILHVPAGLPKPPSVKAVAEGPEGVLASITKDKIWVDHSTTDYEQTEVRTHCLSICYVPFSVFG